MNWIIPTLSILEETLAAPVVAALKKSALAKGQADPLPQMLAEAARRARMAIAAGGEALSAQDGSIPPSLKSAVAWLTLEAAHARVPGLNLGSDQLRMVAEAKKKLERIASGKEVVEKPDDAVFLTDFVASGASMRLVGKREGKINGKTMGTL